MASEKDRRLYGKFTINFPNHPKIAILSDAAFRCLVEATLWCREQERDGWLARRYAVARWGLESLRELSENDPENPSLIEGKDGFDGWYIHDYAEHQETKADVEARRERNRLAGQKGGLARGKRGAKQDGSDALSETQAEKEKEEEEVNTTAKAVVRPRKRGTRLPEGWMPAPTTISEMRVECPTIDQRSEHRKFVDYWTAKTGRDATKLDWDATWRNWIRRASERSPTAAVTSSHDDKVNAFLAMARPDNPDDPPRLEIAQ